MQYIQDLRITEWLLFNTDIGYSNLMALLEDLSVLYKIPFEYIQEDFISVVLKEY